MHKNNTVNEINPLNHLADDGGSNQLLYLTRFYAIFSDPVFDLHYFNPFRYYSEIAYNYA